MEQNKRPTVLEINLNHIAYNVKELKKIAPNAELMAVVKANAYGHGVMQVSKVALANGASWLGVATVEEGIELRSAGFDVPILVLGGILPGQVELCKKHNLDITIGSKNFFDQMKQAVENYQGKQLNVHVKIDTGMHRLGLMPYDLPEFLSSVQELKQVVVRGIWTHFPEAASSRKEFSLEQLRVFDSCVKLVESVLGVIPFKHAANSAGIINLPQSHFNLVRAGLGLYGYYDEADLAKCICLKPALKWKTKITSMRIVPQGDTIGYGRSFVTEKNSIIATIPVGYADGFNRLLSNRGQVLVKGKRSNVIGRVCMDQTMIDVTEIKKVQEGDEVVILGEQDGNTIGLNEMADWVNSIPNEVLVSIKSRVRRVYIT